MNPLITPAQVLALAFTDGESPSPDAVPAAEILVAEVRHIAPVAGRRLLDRLRAGAYPELLEEYVAPALALFVRAALAPRLAVRSGQYGCVQPRSEYYAAASDAQAGALRESLVESARTLLVRLSDHLDAARDDYPEYVPGRNVLHRCRIHGDYVAAR